MLSTHAEYEFLFKVILKLWKWAKLLGRKDREKEIMKGLKTHRDRKKMMWRRQSQSGQAGGSSLATAGPRRPGQSQLSGLNGAVGREDGAEGSPAGFDGLGIASGQWL